MVLAAIPYRTLPRIDVGPLPIRTFGVLVAIGLVVGGAIAVRYVERRGVAREDFTRIAGRAVVAGFIGARLSWVLSHLEQIRTPLDVVAVWEGGLQFTGGFLLAIAWGVWESRPLTSPQRWTVLDGAALGLAPGLAFGRLGCIAVGEHLGGPTGFLLGMTYRGGDTVEGPLEVGTTIHQTALYEFLHLVVLFVLMLAFLRVAARRGRRLPDGLLAGMYVTWYTAARFGTDLLRTYDDRVGGLTGAQWATLALFPLGVALLARALRGPVTPHASASG